jgi:hypothetical protein
MTRTRILILLGCIVIVRTAGAQPYHNYGQACSLLARLAADHPGIARYDTLGNSAGGRPIPRLTVTVAPNLLNARPVVRLIGAHHGDEKIGTEVVLALARRLCEEYESDSLIRALVDARHFVLLPVFNPDGHVRNRQQNDAGVDLDQDHGYEWERYSPAFSQPETRALRVASLARPPAVELIFHAGDSVIQYAWNNHPAGPPDSIWLAALARRYADSTYGSPTTQLDPVRGYSSGGKHGSCSDCTYGLFGGLSWTVETAQPDSQAQADSVCAANGRAALDFARLAGWGIAGRVRDSLTGSPLAATVMLSSPRRWTCWSGVESGDFHRPLPAGTYGITILCNGYLPRSISGVVVPDTGMTYLEVQLTPRPSQSVYYALRLAAVRRNDFYHADRTWAIDALGLPDGRYYDLGDGVSNVVLDLDPPVRDVNGDDITVRGSGNYELSFGYTPFGPFWSLGEGSGTTGFDIADYLEDSLRFFRLSGSVTGASIECIDYTGDPVTGVAEFAACLRPSESRIPTICRGVLFLPETTGLKARVSGLLDAAGRRVSDLHAGANDVSRLVPGVYFISRPSAAGYRAAAAVTRVVVTR